MTEHEARDLVNRIAKLCHEYEKDCGGVIPIVVHDERKTAMSSKFLKFEGSIKIDK